MRRFVVFLLFLTSCNHPSIAPLALFSSPSTKPLVSIEVVLDPQNSHLSTDASSFFVTAVTDRLLQKNRIDIAEKSPQFAVKMQLVGQGGPGVDPTELSLFVHLEILDLRTEGPRIILQEVLSSSVHFTQEQPTLINWDSPVFRLSPLGLAHQKLSREIATRIEDYVLLAKKGSSL